MSVRNTGNYRHGALEEGEHTCDFNAQFEEKRCRLKLRLSSTVCNDTVTLRYDPANPTLESICKQPPDSLVLWSMGNHPLNGESLRLCCLKLHFQASLPKPDSIRLCFRSGAPSCQSQTCGTILSRRGAEGRRPALGPKQCAALCGIHSRRPALSIRGSAPCELPAVVVGTHFALL